MNNTTISTYSLHNSENYNQNITNTINDILNKYYLLITEYLSFITENISVKNNMHSKFIIVRGLETITHVFTNILCCSKNLDMSYYHGQKSFYFYVEFIGQITDENHTFLQLSSRDASMFVYKKTIFEINSELKKIQTKLSKENLLKIDILNCNINIFKNIVNYIIQEVDFSKENKKEQFKKLIMTQIKKNICEKLLNNKITIENYIIIHLFTIHLHKYENLYNDKYCELIELFIKKIVKGKINTNIKNVLLLSDYENYMNEGSEKFVNHIISCSSSE